MSLFGPLTSISGGLVDDDASDQPDFFLSNLVVYLYSIPPFNFKHLDPPAKDALSVCA